MDNIRKYSIIIVTFNNAEGLKRTLESVKTLRYDHKETIVIDGGSKDNSLQVISSYKDIIDTAVSEKDSGIYNAMNKGVKLVTGDYVVFMNAGDVFADEGVLSLVSNYAADIILGSDTYDGRRRLMIEHMSLYDILSIGICHQAVYYRREILQKYGFDESYKIIADLKSVVEPLVKEKLTVMSTPEILAVCEGGGLSKQLWRNIFVEKKRMVAEVVDPFYSTDYQRFLCVDNSMLSDFMVLSRFRSLFPVLRALAKLACYVNVRFKHIPIDD